MAVCAVLLLMMGAAAVWAVRALTVAQRVAANDWRGAQASEAAEAGLAWAVSMMNASSLDGHCQAAGAGTGSPMHADRSFRERILRIDGAGFPRVRPRPGSPPNGWMAACVNLAVQRWECACHLEGVAALPAGIPPTDGAAQPMFSLRLTDTDLGGQFRLTVRGCSHRSTDCESDMDGPIGQAELSQHLALLSALRSPPAGPITAEPGAFRSVFGMPPEWYRQQPGVAILSCGERCDERVAQRMSAGQRVLWIDGDATLHEAAWQAAGTVEPFILIATGRLDIHALSDNAGLVYARNGIRLRSPAGGAARWRGAIVTEGDWAVDGTVTVDHDPALLQAMSRQLGSYLPVPGGWSPAK